MKTYHIELQRVKAMRHADGLIEAHIDAVVQPLRPGDDESPSTRLAMTEENARVLYALLRTQFAELDKRKARSQR